MENAAKALLIAGGILIAIVIISMFLSMYNRVRGIAKTQETRDQTEQLHEFNAQYEAFHKGIMYGVDVITLSNKINNNNDKYKDDENYKITLHLQFKRESDIIVKNITLVDHEGTIYYESSSKTKSDFDKMKFKCTKIEYGSSGRVNEIWLEER